MARLPSVLICDDDSTFHLAVKYALRDLYECRSAYHGDEALSILAKQNIDAILLDVQMRTTEEGLDYLPRLKQIDPEVTIIMSSARTDFETVRRAMKLGASDYIPKDFDPHELTITLGAALERKALIQKNEQQNFEAVSQQKKHVLLGESASIRQLRKTIEKFLNSDANILITGETGTGKEVVARQLRGTRDDGTLSPFVAIDSSTIQGATAESTLFGHEKGAFTGADRTNKGLFEEANHGIIYFDEIGNMPREIQLKLLRVLQEKEVVRLGSSKPLQLEFRVISATNKNLDALAKSGDFAPDLLQRLNVLPLHIPPLRERKEDIAPLLQHYLAAQRSGANKNFSEDALAYLEKYTWPGNVRELINIVAYVSTMADSEIIDITDLPPQVRDVAEKSTRSEGETSESFYKRVSAFERALLVEAYSQAQGNITQLALKLGMDRSHLYTKLREHGVHGTKR
jgi:DNA-binding NtrC family response regulator